MFRFSFSFLFVPLSKKTKKRNSNPTNNNIFFHFRIPSAGSILAFFSLVFVFFFSLMKDTFFSLVTKSHQKNRKKTVFYYLFTCSARAAFPSHLLKGEDCLATRYADPKSAMKKRERRKQKEEGRRSCRFFFFWCSLAVFFFSLSLSLKGKE